ncbi:hypothetical protein [Sphingobium sp. SYK-6]|uniref:hypothetical protein n=1 Tax=Sphingobium sp. (strain NBRC 103272 / SYK-6) TaxID=627192 RepID=UPI0011D2A56E|nr:hypothetical protein [Sphingobium sp. SYK-6]
MTELNAACLEKGRHAPVFQANSLFSADAVGFFPNDGYQSPAWRWLRSGALQTNAKTQRTSGEDMTAVDCHERCR